MLSAPGSYDVEKVEKTVHQKSPAYSFGVKYKDTQVSETPGKLHITNYSQTSITRTSITRFFDNSK